MNRSKFITSLVALSISLCLTAQEQVNMLSEKQVIDWVKKFHPVARQADLIVDKAKADISIARGQFDPQLSANLSNKTFDGNEYYNYIQPEITFPTWFGVEVQAGFENVRGSRIDPHETMGRTSFAGLSLPLAKNLLMDKRRAMLRQAKIFKELSEASRKSLLNDLMLDAVTAYWNWVKAFQIKEVISNAVKINEKRLAMVIAAYQQGDRPAIDSTEALAQLQSFRLALSEAELEFLNAGLELSVYLWSNNEQPVQLLNSVIPDSSWKSFAFAPPEVPAREQIISLATSHPDVLQLDNKLDVQEVDKKLKFQELLPTINLRYNQLGRGYNILKTTAAPLFENNYRYGIQMSIPLRLSQGRGEYKKAKLQIQEIQLERNLKLRNIENSIRATYNEWEIITRQITIQETQFRSYQALQRGEEIRFFNGESSLFLLNSRENKTIESLEKLVTLQIRYFISLTKVSWAAGQLGEP